MPPEQEVGGSNPLGRAKCPSCARDSWASERSGHRGDRRPRSSSPYNHPTILTPAPDHNLANLQTLLQDPHKQGLGQFVFVTGRAGTGKSTLLRQFVAALEIPKAVLAPTGLAAINVGGQTLHSFFNFHLGPIEKHPDQIPVFKRGGQKARLLDKLELLVIDEISMVRADILDAVDASLRWNRRIDQPFGGLPVVVFGDLWQLEPVVASAAEAEFLGHLYQSPFFFDAHVLQETQMDVLYLDHVYRQTDPEYLWALDRLRQGDTTELDFFNERVAAPLDPTKLPLTLTATNGRAQSINLSRLGAISAPPRSYKGTVEGDFGRDLPTDLVLTLKPGAQVMFVKNGRQWVNGTLGTLDSLADDELTVTTLEGKTVTVERETWEKTRYNWNRTFHRIEAEPVGSFTQFPLKLAWAVTTHKSQGLTLEQTIVDLDRPAFAHGQTYVALSRNRHRQGLSLKRPINPQDIIIHPRIHEFATMANLPF